MWCSWCGYNHSISGLDLSLPYPYRILIQIAVSPANPWKWLLVRDIYGKVTPPQHRLDGTLQSLSVSPCWHHGSLVQYPNWFVIVTEAPTHQ